MTEIKLDSDKHDIEDLIRWLDGDFHMSVFDRQQLVKHIRSQIQKPAIQEPQEFGSIVQAWHPREDPSSTPPDLWQRSPMNGKHYWENRNGVCEVWSDLVHPQVLRVGIGEPT